MNVKLIKMQSGEDVVCDLIREEGDRLVISNPVVENYKQIFSSIITPQGAGKIIT